MNIIKNIKFKKKMEKEKIIRISLIIIISLYLFIFTSINLFKSEFDDPPYNYLSKNWLNSPILDIQLLDDNKNTNINEYDNQNILLYFNSDSIKKDLNKFQGKYFNIKTYSSYRYCNFVGFFHNKSGKKVCGKDTQGNILFFPEDKPCPINLILFSNNNTVCNNLNVTCKYQKLNNDLYLVTSNEYISGEIITQLRINNNNQICANSDIDLTFNNHIENYPQKICENDWGYDTIYHEIYQEDLESFLKGNNLEKIKIIKHENIVLSYRGYLGVDDISKFLEHPVDHVTYAKKISISKNIILFISCFYIVFYSVFMFIYEEKNKYNLVVKITFGIYCGLYVFNFLYDAHVIYTYFRVKKIVSTVNLNGIDSYKNGIKPFIIFDILILFGLSSDFSIKLYRFIKFRKNQNIILNN